MGATASAIQGRFAGNSNIPKPRFILQVVPNFEIRDVENDPTVARELDAVGFGIISYTWGRFQDKKKRETSPNAPKFDRIDTGPNPIRWDIPKLQDGRFTIEEVRAIVERLNMKYVWWDWACIPQYWNSDGTPDPDPARRGHIIGTLSDDGLKAVSAEEISKQFYIYTLAKKGFIWMHDIRFVATGSPQVTSIQRMLENEQSGRTLENLGAAVAAARQSVQNFRTMKLEDNWLSSMWTFQEGILLNADYVIDPRNNQLLARRAPSQFARIVDRAGNTFRSDACFRDEFTLIDLTARASLLACDIAGFVTKAIETNQAAIAAELQTLHRDLYETGLVGLAVDSPLSLIEAAKARGVRTMSEGDYCVNAILGALRVVLPDDAPDGLGGPDDLNERRRALLATLVDRYNWKMVLLSKPTRGEWDSRFPGEVTAGHGDWLSILQRTWQFSSLGVFITSRVGSQPPPTAGPVAAHVIPDDISVTQLVPYTPNVLLMGAAAIRDHIALPQLRHSRVVEAELGVQPFVAPSDAMVIGPEDASFGNATPLYGFFCYGGLTVTTPASGVAGAGGATTPVVVPEGPAWTACRFYASEALNVPQNPGIYPVKSARCFVKEVDFGVAFRNDTFGANVPVVLLPIEDVSVYSGTIETNDVARVVVVRCVVLTDFRTGPMRGTGSANTRIGGGIFLGIGDFTFPGSPQAVTVKSVLGDGWMIYMY